MQVRIRMRWLELSRAERARVERRVRLVLGAGSGGLSRADVALVPGEDGPGAPAWRCRVTLWPRTGPPVRAESEGDEPVETAARAARRAGRGRGLRTEGGPAGPLPAPGLRA